MVSIKTENLKNILKITGYWWDKDESIFEELLNLENKGLVKLADLCIEEIKLNVLQAISKNQKEMMIKSFIDEFRNYGLFFRRHSEILYQRTAAYVYKEGICLGTFGLDNEQNYVYKCYTLFEMVFEEIQSICYNNKINYTALCNDINFDIFITGNGDTLPFEKIHNDIPPPILSNNEFSKKVEMLKPEFDKLTDYNEKLNFWHDNGFDIGIIANGNNDDIEKKYLLEDYISINPENSEEKIAYKKFYYKTFHKYNFKTLEISIANYAKDILEGGANPIQYTKNQIRRIDENYKDTKNKFKNIGINKLLSYCNGFDASENGKIEVFLNDSSFNEKLPSYFAGEVDEKYKRFLTKQLKKLESNTSETLDNSEKLIIAYKIIGENKYNSSSPVFHHIKEVLKSHKLTPLEAREILLDMQGANSPAMNKKVVEPIIKYLERINEPELKYILTKQTETKHKADEVKELHTSTPENPHPLIFKNGYAYQMFLELKGLTVKTRTVVADYSFIFHKMKGKNLKAINAVITEPAFIEFLNKHFQANISAIKLPIRNPDNKQQTYSTVLTKYKECILS